MRQPYRTLAEDKYETSWFLRRRTARHSPVQGAINKILGATPRDPIRIPIQFGQVEVKAERGTQMLLIGVAGILTAGIIVYAISR